MDLFAALLFVLDVVVNSAMIVALAMKNKLGMAFLRDNVGMGSLFGAA